MRPIIKKTLLIIAVISAIVLIADFMALFLARETINGTVFGIIALISGPLAIIPALFLIAPKEMGVLMEQNNIASRGFLPRTKESTLFEIASALIIVCMWVIALASHSKDFYIPIITTVFVIGLLAAAYFTDKRSWTIWEAKNMRQLMIRGRFRRVLAVEIALFGMLTVCPGVNQTFIGVTFLVITILSYILFAVSSYRARD